MAEKLFLPKEWAVFGLEAGDGFGDSNTRLTVSLRESLAPATPAALTSFTLCVWYYATAFLDASTLLSYAVSDHLDDVIRLREGTFMSLSSIRFTNIRTRYAYYFINCIV